MVITTQFDWNFNKKLFVSFSGETIFIPRVRFAPKDHTLPIEMIRTQFPVKLAFSITSNKSQGQTLKHVGIYLQQDFFAHGQVRNYYLFFTWCLSIALHGGNGITFN